jgi:2-oxoisovalerate dehydrogenase E1 component
MSNGQVQVPVIVRASCGAIKNAGPHHSGMYHPIWAHCPGLIVVVPSNPADAKGLMKTALRAYDPVIFLEHKLLFGSKGPVPVGGHFVPFGQAAIVRPGRQLTVVTCGELVWRCVEAARELDALGVSCEIIDLRTIVPLDTSTIFESVARTGRLLIVDEAFSMCGIGAEIAAAVMEEVFDELDAPVGRLHPDTVTQPFSPPLENEIVVSGQKIVAAARAVVAGRPIVARRLRGASPPASPATVAGDGESGRHGPIATAVIKSSQPAVSGVPIMMPNQDLTVTEATIVRWIKKPGDRIRKDEAIVEVETAKAVFPVEAPVDGALEVILAAEGKVVKMGESLGTIRPS